MKPSTDFSRLSFVPFSKFDLWDVKRYTYNSNLNGENFVILSSLLKPYKKSVSKDEMIKNKWQIISKINFGGELFLRDFDEINSYKGNLFLVPQNSIIYSKINVRHGCFYFNDKEGTPFGVSNEYPIFNFDDSKVDGRFLQKLLRTGTFKNLLNSKTSGISKARVKQEEFLSIEIPLPTLAEQKKIVDAYERKINEAKTLELNAENLESEIERYLFEELGVQLEQKSNNHKGLQFVNFTDIERWDILFLMGQVDQIGSKYKIKKFSQVITSFNKGQDGKSLRIDSSKFPQSDFRYIGMEHIEKKTGTLLELQNVKGGEIKSQTINVPRNFMIYGKLRPYLNKYWVNNTGFDNIICSSEFFVFDIDEEKLDKNFFKYVLASEIIQSQINDKTSGA